MVFLWDATYEATPTDTLIRSLIDDEIRHEKYAIRERMSPEHEWGPSSTLNDGSHILGGTTVTLVDSEAVRDALVDPQLGSLFVVLDGANYKLSLMTSGGWEYISSLSHDDLTDRGEADDHPQYVPDATGALTGTLDMNGNLIHTNETGVDCGNVLLYGHRNFRHPNFGSLDAITANAITAAKLRTTRLSTTTTLGAGDVYSWITNLYEFFPQLYQLSFEASNPLLIARNTANSVGFGWGLVNNAGGSTIVRIRREWIA